MKQTTKKFTGAKTAWSLPKPSLLNVGTCAKRVPTPFRRVRFRVPRGIQTLVLTFPAVRAEIEFEFRLANVLAARALIATGFSQNLAARALGLSVSNMSIWLRAYRERGADALRPKLRRGTADTCTLAIHLSRKMISADAIAARMHPKREMGRPVVALASANLPSKP